jgi:predicted Zn-dependent protease
MSEPSDIESIIEDATFDFTMGDAPTAISKLERLLEGASDSFPAWHALCEIHYSEKNYPAALEAAEKAHALKPDDLFINTSLSRIWLELGSKEKAEHFGAQAKIASWKDQLKNPDASEDEIVVN